MNNSALAEIWPLSPLQEGLLFHARYDERARDVYVGQHAVHLDGPVDAAVLRASWEVLLHRHAALRAGFQRRRSGAPVQIIVRAPALTWREADLSHLPPSAAEAEAARIATVERDRGFEVSAPPLLRPTLIRMAESRHRMLVTMHHIVLDGWSLPILFDELSRVYAAGGDASVLPPTAPYRDYLAWLSRQDREAARTAWADALGGLDEPTLLVPGGTDGDPVLPEHVAVRTGAPDTARLRTTARALGVTPNTVVQGAWGLAIGALTGRRDVVFGATVSGRPADLPGVERMLGLFINTLPVRVTLDPSATVAATLTALQEHQSALLAHQHLGLAEVQRAAGPGAAFDTLIVYESFPGDPSATRVPGGLDITEVGGDDASHYPLTLVVSPGDDDLELRLDYRPDLFDGSAARTILDLLVRVLRRFAADPDARVAEVEVLSPEERRLVVEGWNATDRPVADASLVELFEECVVRAPDAVAVVAGGVVWTYGELNARANGVACALVGRGVVRGSLVGVRMERSPELVAVLLGVLKAGAAYVPLDVSHPQERLASIVAEAGVSVVVTGEDVFEPVEENPRVHIRGRIWRM
ncbi:condensation domain-containing protein [Actinomadura sp. WMMB 499]|uniref:condensation domain-containing protein n=1 Tax=Actinomadura sp. WMMB 499 TaxID=1219491 RepID=UPI0012461B30|nr:condensation domain-containing protein [Actinomadura sp. WMMB 499]QFG21429.1 AMP-binding protein [Actinomadura sp. WMMB 499]